MKCAVNERLKWAWLPCFGHNLHLAVSNAMKGDNRITRTLAVSRKIVSTFTHSWKKKRALTEVQTALNLPLHSLKTDCTTRWGSTQLMISRILEQKDAIRQVLRTDPKLRHLSPTWQDFDILESVQAATGPLIDFTDSLSGENSVTVSAIVAVLHIFKTDILAPSDDDTTLTSNIKSQILRYMENKYEPEGIKTLVQVTSYLDPRFCTTYINHDDLEKIKTRILDEGVAIASLQQSTSDNPSSEDQLHHAKKTKLGSWLVKAHAAATEQNIDNPATNEDKVKKEMELYEHTIRVHPDCNPLDWWKVNTTNYVILSHLAKKYLCVNASSCASERVFSASGHIVSKKRTLLKPDIVNMLVFLSKNL